MKEKLERREFERRLDLIKICGVNRGPHKYIPIKWKCDDVYHEEAIETVEVLMCTVCFSRVSIDTLSRHFPEHDLGD